MVYEIYIDECCLEFYVECGYVKLIYKCIILQSCYFGDENINIYFDF